MVFRGCSWWQETAVFWLREIVCTGKQCIPPNKLYIWRQQYKATIRRATGRTGKTEEIIRAIEARTIEEAAAFDSLENISGYDPKRKQIYENLRLFMPFYHRVAILLKMEIRLMYLIH